MKKEALDKLVEKYFRVSGVCNDLTNDDDFKGMAKMLSMEALATSITRDDITKNLMASLMSMMALGFAIAYQAAIEAGADKTEINRILNEYDGGNNE